jgi:hypothetical protein
MLASAVVSACGLFAHGRGPLHEPWGTLAWSAILYTCMMEMVCLGVSWSALCPVFITIVALSTDIPRVLSVGSVLYLIAEIIVKKHVVVAVWYCWVSMIVSVLSIRTRPVLASGLLLILMTPLMPWDWWPMAFASVFKYL